MTKLELLLKTMATALGVPLGSVEASWTRLRKAKLWTPVGRGRVRPDPTPSDATNLLLSFLVGGPATDTPDVVRLVRQSRMVMPGEDGRRAPPLPHIEGLTNGSDTTLGSVFPALLTHVTLGPDQEYREFKAELRGAPRLLVPYEISVYRTWMGWHTTVRMMLVPFPEKADEQTLSLDFWAESPDPDVKRLLAERDLGRARDALLTYRRYSKRTTRETITGDVLSAIAACLEGDGEKADNFLGASIFQFHSGTDAEYPNAGVYRDGRAGLIHLVVGPRRRRR